MYIFLAEIEILKKKQQNSNHAYIGTMIYICIIFPDSKQPEYSALNDNDAATADDEGIRALLHFYIFCLL